MYKPKTVLFSDIRGEYKNMKSKFFFSDYLVVFKIDCLWNMLKLTFKAFKNTNENNFALIFSSFMWEKHITDYNLPINVLLVPFQM